MSNHVKVADEVWLATAALHQKHPDQADFSVGEIMAQAEADAVMGKPLRPGVRVHVHLHCVANKAPNPGRYRMLYEPAPGRRRLFRPGDPCHPRRSTGKKAPARDALPAEYRDLVDWYSQHYASANGQTSDPVLALRGLGKEVWAGEDADAYVQRQRADWR
ncbi:MAG: hypothetical protein OXJ53_11630 [Gammaproteobacteria bacterium]|nr:hypothetical protein [Gammaproteobacteria bacterium]MDE0273167.1 hypothetical protein [Gammaproteobacteria bacterium]